MNCDCTSDALRRLKLGPAEPPRRWLLLVLELLLLPAGRAGEDFFIDEALDLFWLFAL